LSGRRAAAGADLMIYQRLAKTDAMAYTSGAVHEHLVRYWC
jgi:hypothetical protein